MDMEKTENTKVRICPRCGREYSEPPALSRADNTTLICSDCGSREALKTLGISSEEQDLIIVAMHQHRKK